MASVMASVRSFQLLAGMRQASEKPPCSGQLIRERDVHQPDGIEEHPRDRACWADCQLSLGRPARQG